MKFNQMERAIVVSCAAVFLLATADAMEMKWVCPTNGIGSCSLAGATDAQQVPVATTIRMSRRVEAEVQVEKITSRLDVPLEQVENRPAR